MSWAKAAARSPAIWWEGSSSLKRAGTVLACVGWAGGATCLSNCCVRNQAQGQPRCGPEADPGADSEGCRKPGCRGKTTRTSLTAISFHALSITPCDCCGHWKVRLYGGCVSDGVGVPAAASVRAESAWTGRIRFASDNCRHHWSLGCRASTLPKDEEGRLVAGRGQGPRRSVATRSIIVNK